MTYTVNGKTFTENELCNEYRRLSYAMMQEGASFNNDLLIEFDAVEQVYNSLWSK